MRGLIELALSVPCPRSPWACGVHPQRTCPRPAWAWHPLQGFLQRTTFNRWRFPYERSRCIPEAEYQERVKKAAALIQEHGLDVLVVNSNEADYANVRYFSNFWPLFETAGVAIGPSGKAALMVGPESGKYSADRSMIQNIFQLMEYRESADPAYPEVKASKYTDVFNSHRGQRARS